MLIRRIARNHQRPLGHVLGQIADALQIGRNLQRGQRLAQIERQRLAQRQQAHHLLLDVEFKLIDVRVQRHGLFRQSGIAPDDGVDGVGELRFAHPAHLDDGRAQCFELVVKRFDDVFGHACLLADGHVCSSWSWCGPLSTTASNGASVCLLR